MENNSIITISTIVIALSALVVTIWQGIIMRKHNRLAVIPHLRIIRNYLTPDKVSYVLKNCGIGPAILTSLQLKVDGKIFPEYNDPMYRGVLKLIFPRFNGH